MASDNQSTLPDYEWFKSTPPRADVTGAHLVFSYGSNMGRGQIASRCPQSKFVDTGRLKSFRWHINNRGYANLLDSDSDEVLGLVHVLSDSDLARLDQHEGVTQGIYQRVEVSVLLEAPRSIVLGRARATEDDQVAPRQQVGHSEAGEERMLQCWAYLDRNNVEDGPPVDEYVDRINTGVLDAVLSAGYVESTIRRQLPYREPPTPLPHQLYFFVYGTLKRGGSNYHWLARNNAHYVSTAVLRHAELYHVFTYPGAVQSANPQSVILGELYSCDSYKAVDDLDQLEGYVLADEDRSLYLRRPAWVETPDGHGVQATIYWYNRPTGDLKLLPNGFFPVSLSEAPQLETDRDLSDILLEQGIGAEYVELLLAQAEQNVHTALLLWDIALADGHIDRYRAAPAHDQ